MHLLVQLAKTAEVKSSEPKSSDTETQIAGQVTKEIGERLNIGPGEEWFHKHSGDPKFGLIERFVFTLGEIEAHATKAWLTMNGEGENSDSNDLLVESEMAKLYDLDPDGGVWVAQFWRQKALAANCIYLQQHAQALSHEVPPAGVDPKDFEAQNLKRYSDDTEVILATYYFDHWQQIKSMIMDSLITATVRAKSSK